MTAINKSTEKGTEQRRYPFAQVDAFTETRLQGNPCAIIMNADDITDTEMLGIAKEMNLSETSFVLPSVRADFRFRFFTPAEEIPLAGHPTLATVFRLLELGLIPKNKTSLTIELTAGIINVRIEETPSGPLIVMQQLPPRFLKIYSVQEIAPLFGLTTADVRTDVPLQTVSTGTPMLMIPLREPSILKKVQFDGARFSERRASSDFFSAHLFALENNETVARHFCPPPDIAEDPFTGSATGAMACYLWKYKMINKSEFTAHQGMHLGRPGKGFVKILGSPDVILGVEVSGHAITCLQGELIL